MIFENLSLATPYLIFNLRKTPKSFKEILSTNIRQNEIFYEVADQHKVSPHKVLKDVRNYSSEVLDACVQITPYIEQLLWGLKENIIEDISPSDREILIEQAHAAMSVIENMGTTALRNLKQTKEI